MKSLVKPWMVARSELFVDCWPQDGLELLPSMPLKKRNYEEREV